MSEIVDFSFQQKGMMLELTGYPESKEMKNVLNIYRVKSFKGFDKLRGFKLNYREIRGVRVIVNWYSQGILKEDEKICYVTKAYKNWKIVLYGGDYLDFNKYTHVLDLDSLKTFRTKENPKAIAYNDELSKVLNERGFEHYKKKELQQSFRLLQRINRK